MGFPRLFSAQKSHFLLIFYSNLIIRIASPFSLNRNKKFPRCEKEERPSLSASLALSSVTHTHSFFLFALRGSRSKWDSRSTPGGTRHALPPHYTTPITPKSSMYGFVHFRWLCSFSAFTFSDDFRCSIVLFLESFMAVSYKFPPSSLPCHSQKLTLTWEMSRWLWRCLIHRLGVNFLETFWARTLGIWEGDSQRRGQEIKKNFFFGFKNFIKKIFLKFWMVTKQH